MTAIEMDEQRDRGRSSRREKVLLHPMLAAPHERKKGVHP
jgi:hypothetical protein